MILSCTGNPVNNVQEILYSRVQEILQLNKKLVTNKSFQINNIIYYYISSIIKYND